MKKGLAVFSGPDVVHKLMQDGTVVLGTAANQAAVTVSGSVNVTGQMTASANSVLVGNVGGEFTNTTLGGILVELKTSGSAGAATVDARLTSVSSSLGDRIDTEKDRIDAILSLSDADKDSFKQIVDLINSVDTTNDLTFAGYVLTNNAAVADINVTASQMRSDFNAYTSSNDAALTAEQIRASGIEAGLQSQIDASVFQVNDMSVTAKSGSFIITGSSNVSIGNASGVVTVSLNDSVTLAGTLSANVVSASAGLSVVGGASVAGGMTVSSGDMSVSQGAVSVKMTRVQAAARTAQDGDMFYLTDTDDDNASTWPRGKAWYFKQNGDWFDAPFYGEG